MTRTMCALAAICSLAASLAAVASPATAQPSEPRPAPTLDRLLEQFREIEGLEATFSEEKRIALLAVPLRSEGRIYFARPDRLLRQVTAPEASSALIAQGQLRMRQGARVEVIPIDDNPVLRGFVDSFRAVLAGDRAALDRYYDATLSARPAGGDDGWELRLVPRDAALRRFLREITMRGDGTTIDEMVMTEVSGDETRTRFADVRRRRFSPAEAQRVFRID